ncbi:hypothetical protein VHEMI02859 [[Torrubiella] hemipterigena]|uniref:Uncharacterized protein n=1 Tax=[Torrubiella] hemipterigena TaxID=1531966 RepID=A0A0A1T952_9HYPO|nr:hypothetical protein VHEMI02859 [[Torrubiella] hemipterigena]
MRRSLRLAVQADSATRPLALSNYRKGMRQSRRDTEYKPCDYHSASPVENFLGEEQNTIRVSFAVTYIDAV